MRSDQVLSELQHELQRSGRVALIGSYGTGKTRTLKLLQRQLPNSMYVQMHSYRDALGELFYQILALDWGKAQLIGRKGLATVARYLPQEFVPFPLPRPTPVVSVEELSDQVWLTLLALLKAYGIKALLLDGLEPDEVDNVLLHLLTHLSSQGVKLVLATAYPGIALEANMSQVDLLSSQGPVSGVVQLFVDALGLDVDAAFDLAERTGGNLFSAQLLLRTGTSTLEEAVAREKQRDPQLFTALGYLSFSDTWFSPLSRELVDKHLLGGKHTVLESDLVMEEGPQFRFLSPEVKELVTQLCALEAKQVHHWFAVQLSKLGLPNYWLRVANRFGSAGEERSQAFALIMAAKYAPTMDLKASYLEQALHLQPQLMGTRRALADAYNCLGQPDKAIRVLGKLDNLHLLDRARLVRHYVADGKNQEASRLAEELSADLDSLESMLLPGVIADMAPYILTVKDDPNFIMEMYAKLMADSCPVPSTHWGAFLNAVAIATERYLKYEVALDLYEKSRELLAQAPTLELMSRPIINQTSLLTTMEGAKSILENMDLLQELLPQVSTRPRQVIWSNLFAATREFLTRTNLQNYTMNLQKLAAESPNPHYRFEEYSILANHYLDVLDLGLAKWFLKLAAKEISTPAQQFSWDLLQASLNSTEKEKSDPDLVKNLISRALELQPPGGEIQSLVALAISNGVTDIPQQLLNLMDETPYSGALRTLAAHTLDASAVARHFLRMWRRWERLSMSKAGKLLLARTDQLHPQVLKTLVNWVFDEASALDYPQLTQFWQQTFYGIAAQSDWPRLLRWHFNLLEVNNVDQLKGAMDYLLSQFFTDFFAKVESGSLNLELGDSRFVATATETINRQGVVRLTVHSSGSSVTAPIVVELLGYTLEQVNSHLFGLQDPLTGLFNRTYGNYRLQEQWELYARHSAVFSILFLDLDNFKHLNDTYGHEAGDRALMAVARALTASARNTDVVVRWGGDEFLIILPETPVSATDALIRRIENSLSALNVIPNEVIRASVGYAGSDEAITVENMLDLADKRAYMAKAQHQRELTK